MSRSASGIGGPYVTSDLAPFAPHVRSPLCVHSAFRWVLVASFPCLLMALYNTGFQAGLAAQPGGWRGRAVTALAPAGPTGDPIGSLALGLVYTAPLFAAVWLGAGAAEWCFARARGRPADHGALPLISLLFALSVPATIPLWQAGLGAAVAIVVGKEIFGGVGRNFVHPVVVGLAFLYFAYPASVGGESVWAPVSGSLPTTPLSIATRSGLDGLRSAGLTWGALAVGRVPAALGHSSALAAALGACVLVGAGVASWRILVGGVLGLLVGVVALQGLGVERPIATLPWHWHLVSGSFAFGLAFLATDPVTSTTTNPGRWIHGLLVGAAVAVIRIANPAHEDGVVLALLLANVTAPLIDWCSARAQYRLGQRRSRRNG